MKNTSLISISLCVMYLTLSGCVHTPEQQAVKNAVDPTQIAKKFFQPVFPAMDCELIGQAHKDEIDEHFPALYFFLDTDHDRTIRLQELEQAQLNASSAEQTFLFQQMDTNQDGGVTPKEYTAYAYSAFDLLDLNQDGDLTETEVDMQSFRKAAQP